MADKIFEYHPASVVSLKIEDFSGPIDVLYKLITENDAYGSLYDIRTFPLHLVTDQFVFYLGQLDKIDADVASDFIKIATTLLKIKASVLAYVPVDDDGEEFEAIDFDAETELRRRLEIYKIVQDNVQILKSREKINRINRQPKYSDSDAIIVINKFNINKLLDAFGEIVMLMDERVQNPLGMQNKTIPKDPYPLSEESVRLTKMLHTKKKVGFYSLFDKKITKGQVISDFQALLRLVSKQVLLVKQESDKDEIEIEFNPELDVEGVNLEALASVDGSEEE